MAARRPSGGPQQRGRLRILLTFLGAVVAFLVAYWLVDLAFGG